MLWHHQRAIVGTWAYLVACSTSGSPVVWLLVIVWLYCTKTRFNVASVLYTYAMMVVADVDEETSRPGNPTPTAAATRRSRHSSQLSTEDVPRLHHGPANSQQVNMGTGPAQIGRTQRHSRDQPVFVETEEEERKSWRTRESVRNILTRVVECVCCGLNSGWSSDIFSG